MYTTRQFNPKQAESYLSIGDPYDKTNPPDRRYKGRQFQTAPPKSGQLHGYFEDFKYQTDSYQDTNGYRITQPRSDRRLGFGSLDAHRRDEFTLDIRAAQYKELLDREKFFTAKYAHEQTNRDDKRRKDFGSTEGSEIDSASSTGDSLDRLTRSSSFSSTQPDPLYFQTQVPALLYDIGKETGTTPICNKCSRETFYCKHRVNISGSASIRRKGSLKTSNEIIGAEIKTIIKPQLGRKSQLKDFYDNNHLSVTQQ